jgi:hypothetical protein
MKLDTRAFAIAAAVVAAALFTICAFFVAVAPRETTNVLGYLIHVDLSGLSRSLTWGNYFISLVSWSLGTGIVFGGMAWLYNRLARS